MVTLVFSRVVAGCVVVCMPCWGSEKHLNGCLEQLTSAEVLAGRPLQRGCRRLPQEQTYTDQMKPMHVGMPSSPAFGPALPGLYAPRNRAGASS